MAKAVTLLDFEGFMTGTIMDNEYQVFAGVAFSALNHDNGLRLAAVLDRDNPTGGDGVFGAPFAPDNPA